MYTKEVFMLASYANFPTIFSYCSIYIQTDISVYTNPPTLNFSHIRHFSKSKFNTLQLQTLVEPPIIKQMPLMFGFLKAGWKFSDVAKTKMKKNHRMCPFGEIPTEVQEVSTGNDDCCLLTSVPACSPRPVFAGEESGTQESILPGRNRGILWCFKMEKKKYWKMFFRNAIQLSTLLHLHPHLQKTKTWSIPSLPNFP